MYEWHDVISAEPPDMAECFLMTLSGSILFGVKPKGGKWVTAPADSMNGNVSGAESDTVTLDPVIIWSLFPDPAEMIDASECLPSEDGLYVIWDKNNDIIPYVIAEFRKLERKFFMNNEEQRKSPKFHEWEIDVSRWADFPKPLPTEEIRKYMT